MSKLFNLTTVASVAAVGLILAGAMAFGRAAAAV